MKRFFAWTLTALILGGLVGTALAYFQARPWRLDPSDYLAAPHPQGEPSGESSPDLSRPQLACEAFEFDFGKMEMGTSQRHVFPVGNEGQAPLLLTFVSSTCQCTAVRLDGKQVEANHSMVVPPGETTQVELEWAAKGDPRPFRHGATFTSNDPANSRVSLEAVGELVSSTSLHPPYLHFDTVTVGEAATTSLTINSFADEEIKVLDYRVEDQQLADKVEISFEPLSAKPKAQPVVGPQEPTAGPTAPDSSAQSGLRVVAKLKPAKTLGRLYGTLHLETNLPQAKQLSLPITAHVVGDISIFGSGWRSKIGLLQMKPIDGNAGGGVNLTLAIRGVHAPQTTIEVASIQPGELTAELGEPQDLSPRMRHIPLAVKVRPGTRPMVRQGGDRGKLGEIVLRTTHPLTTEFRIEVAFIVK